MPLAFESLSHGTIAFGFFNIESDMLLLERYFFFNTDFCRNIGRMAEHDGEKPYHDIWPVHCIRTAEDVGDLMGAIHGIRFTGFIGHLYRRFPFPQNPQDFKQNPEGFRTQTMVSEIIKNYADLIEIVVRISADETEIDFGEYRFNRFQFHELIKYVLRGGYPRWKDEIKPDCVIEMNDKINQTRKKFFCI